MKKLFIFLLLCMTSITVVLAQNEPASAAPTPIQDAANVKSIYGEHYVSVAPTNNFATWGSANEGIESYTISGTDMAEKVTNFGYLGNQFNTTLDMSDMNYLHVDIYPDKDMTIGITPITQGGENSLPFNIKANQWNSVDIPLVSYPAANPTMNFQYTFQIKWDKGNGETLYLDNIYFYKDVTPDTQAPTLNSVQVTPSSTKATFTFNATDNKPAISYVITDATNNKTYTTTGTSGTDVSYTVTGLTPNTTYSMSVVAKDGAGNTSDPQTINFTTTSASLVATAPDANGIVVLSGAWDATEFATIDATYKASAYDMTSVTDIPAGTGLNTADPNALIISVTPGKINKNEVVKNTDNTGYQGYNIQFNEQFNDNATTHDICTALSPITAANPSFHRVFSRADIYFTTVVPYDVASFSDLIAYELSSATTTAGVTTLMFKEVTSLKKGVPYLMYAKTGGAHLFGSGDTTINFSTSPVAFNGGSFNATYTAMNNLTAALNKYALPDNATSAEMTLCTDGSSINALRSFVQLDEGNTNTLKIQLTLAYDENNTENFTPMDNANIEITRTVTAGQWNTLSLPFNLTRTSINDVFGTASQVATFTGDAENILQFTSTSGDITAGTPFIINPENTVNKITVNNVSINNTATPVEGTGYTFYPVFKQQDINAGTFYIANGNLLKTVQDTGGHIKAFRAYFIPVNSNTNEAKDFSVDGIATGIKNINAETEMLNTDIYNLNGQYMSHSVKNLKKGIYIANGKKIVIR